MHSVSLYIRASRYAISPSSSSGAAGTHIGQELDGFFTLSFGHHTIQAGVSHFFKGEFVRETTPGINPRYFYISQEYIIK